jgi:hypothetical protein
MDIWDWKRIADRRGNVCMEADITHEFDDLMRETCFSTEYEELTITVRRYSRNTFVSFYYWSYDENDEFDHDYTGGGDGDGIIPVYGRSRQCIKIDNRDFAAGWPTFKKQLSKQLHSIMRPSLGEWNAQV